MQHPDSPASRLGSLNRREFLLDSALATTGMLCAVSGAPSAQSASVAREVRRTRSYQPGMEYRRLGKTGLWVSAVCLGGHWKRIEKIIGSQEAFASCEDLRGNDADLERFHRNRHDVISRCIDAGINCIDFAGAAEPYAYARALRGRRDRMYLCWSMGAQEMRHPDHRQARFLVGLLEKGLRETGLEYADVWRIMAHERGSLHTQAETDQMLEALTLARQRGLCRFTGISTHDRPWAKRLIETYPDVIQVLVTPYTSQSKELPADSLFDAIRKHDVGVLGIKPFASNSLFQGDGSPDHAAAEADDRRARLALRYILGNPAITAPIPGLISVHQVDNAVRAVRERRELDLAEREELDAAGRQMWASLPAQYRWLKDWEYV